MLSGADQVEGGWCPLVPPHHGISAPSSGHALRGAEMGRAPAVHTVQRLDDHDRQPSHSLPEWGEFYKYF